MTGTTQLVSNRGMFLYQSATDTTPTEAEGRQLQREIELAVAVMTVISEGEGGSDRTTIIFHRGDVS